MAQPVDPLNYNAPISDKQGKPTPLFMRQWQNLIKLAIDTASALASALAANASVASLLTTFNGRTVNAGTGLTGGGNLSANITLALGNTSVAPGSYGDGNNVGQFTVDQQGRLTFAGNVSITVGAAPAVYWNDHAANMGAFILHPDRLTVTGTYNAATIGAMLGSSSHSSGKWYFEFKYVRASGTHYPLVGLGNASMLLNNFVGHGVGDWGMGPGGSAFTNNTASSGLSTYAANDILGITVDFAGAGTGNISFYKNNVLNKAYGSLTLGSTPLFPAVSLNGDNGSPSGTLQATVAQCTYSPPAGFSNWG